MCTCTPVWKCDSYFYIRMLNTPSTPDHQVFNKPLQNILEHAYLVEGKRHTTQISFPCGERTFPKCSLSFSPNTANLTRGGIGGYGDLSNGNMPVWSPKELHYRCSSVILRVCILTSSSQRCFHGFSSNKKAETQVGIFFYAQQDKNWV